MNPAIWLKHAVATRGAPMTRDGGKFRGLQICMKEWYHYRGHVTAGWHSVAWSGGNDAGEISGPGVYFVRIRAGDFTSTNKILLMK